MPITVAQAIPGTKVKIPTSTCLSDGWLNPARLARELQDNGYTKPYLIIQDGIDEDYDVSLNMGNKDDVYENVVNILDLDLYVEEVVSHSYTLLELEDPINPSHYKGKEVFQQMIQAFGVEEVKVFCKVNAYKYLVRAGKKAGNSEAQDLAKCNWYLNELQTLLSSHGN